MKTNTTTNNNATMAAAMKAAGLSDAQIRIAIAALSSKGGGKSVPKECKCGCGEMTKGGTYRPGHDAKHMSAVLKAARVGVTAVA